LLEGLARGTDQVALGALRGLRWFDHPEGWQLIRRQAQGQDWSTRNTAIDLLGHNDDPTTRDLLLRLLAQVDFYALFETALAAARRLWGNDSLEPDYAAVQNKQFGSSEEYGLLERLQKHGDAKRMLEVLPRLGAEAAARVKEILLSRQPLPIAEAQTVAAGPDVLAAGVAAHLLGRAGKEAAGSGPVIEAALRRWWKEWDRGRQEEVRRGRPPGQDVGTMMEPLQSLIWAAGRLGVGADTLVAVATTRGHVPYDRPLRREAAIALALSPSTPAVLSALDGLVNGDDPEVRALAAQAIARDDPRRAGPLAGRILSDRVAVNRVAASAPKEVEATLRGAAVQVHYQGVAIPHLAGRQDVEGLTAVAGNRGFSEETRLGAIEGLAAAVSIEAEQELIRIGTSADEPEELRKAAWRGLRRSKRARAKKAKKETSA
jgi:ParB family chromosome partitioning protein